MHPLVDCSLASLATTFRRDSRCTEDSVKERDKSLNGGIVGGGMKSQAMGAMNEVSVTGPDKRMAEGLGNGGTGGAAGDGALSLRRRQEEEIEGEGNREMLGDLEGKEGGGACVERWNGEASEPRERALGDAAVKEAGSPRGRGDRGVQKGKESARSQLAAGGDRGSAMATEEVASTEDAHRELLVGKGSPGSIGGEGSKESGLRIKKGKVN